MEHCVSTVGTSIDTLMLMKPSDSQLVKESFEDSLPRFLKIEIHNNDLKIYRKETSGHYTDFKSFGFPGFVHKLADKEDMRPETSPWRIEEDQNFCCLE